MARPSYLPTVIQFETRQRHVADEVRLLRDSAAATRSSRRRRYLFNHGDSGWITVSTVRHADVPASDGA